MTTDRIVTEDADEQPPAVATSDPARRARGPRGLKPKGYLWIVPAMVFSAGLIYYCVAYTGFMSAFDWDGVSPTRTSVGLQNYTELFRDPLFWRTIRHTAVFFGGTFVLQTALGLTFAVMLHSEVRLRTFYKVVVFVPVMLAPAIMAPVFRQIFDDRGQLNSVLEFFGLGFLAHPWLADSATAMPVIMGITIWQWTGLTFILYFAALSQIEPEMIEAARIDGAGNIRVITAMVIPSVRKTTIALLLLGIIGGLKTFDVPWLVTLGGPNYATEFLGTFIYRESIPQANVGYASAASMMLLLISLGLAIPVGLRAWRKAD